MKICVNKHLSNYTRKKDRENDLIASENGSLVGTCPVCGKEAVHVEACSTCQSCEKCHSKKTWMTLNKCIKADEVLRP